MKDVLWSIVIVVSFVVVVYLAKLASESDSVGVYQYYENGFLNTEVRIDYEAAYLYKDPIDSVIKYPDIKITRMKQARHILNKLK